MKGNRIGTEQLAAIGMTLVVASVVVGFLAIGCGREQAETSAKPAVATKSSTQTNALASTNGATPAAGIADQTPPADEATATTAANIDSLPPDILASAPDNLVLPGDIVEIKAQGTVDVTEMTLTDARGKTQPLVYDAAAAIWRAQYRVPLHTATERVGLSLTAKNGFNQWRRVWVFLKVYKEPAKADSAGN